jgi:hypothetical protein
MLHPFLILFFDESCFLTHIIYQYHRQLLFILNTEEGTERTQFITVALVYCEAHQRSGNDSLGEQKVFI